jgi:hypothetical protein
MPQRRRYAHRAELEEMLVGLTNCSRGQLVFVMDALQELGVDVDALVKVTVDEDVAPDLQ